MILEQRVDQLLLWLHDAENDLGELADIVNSMAATQGMVSQARRANELAHKWIHRRSLRETRAQEGETSQAE